MDNHYIAQIAYQKSVLGIKDNGIPNGFTVRPIKAKNIDQAQKRLVKYWNDKYRGYKIIKLEIYQEIDEKYD